MSLSWWLVRDENKKKLKKKSKNLKLRNVQIKRKYKNIKIKNKNIRKNSKYTEIII